MLRHVEEEILDRLEAERVDRRRRAEALARETGGDVGVIEGHLFLMTLSPQERLARGLMRGRWRNLAKR
jgi:hypothetical protein